MEVTRVQAVAVLSALGWTDASEWSKSKMQNRLDKLHEIVGDDQVIGDEDLDNLLDELIGCGAEGETIVLISPIKPPANGGAQATPRPSRAMPKVAQSVRKPKEVVEEETEEELVEDEVVEETTAAEVDGVEDEDEVVSKDAVKPVKKTSPAPKPATTVRPKKPQLTAEKKQGPPKAASVGKKALPSRTSVTPDSAEAVPLNRLSGVRPSLGRPYYAGVVLEEFGVEDGVTDEMVARLDHLVGGVPNTRESIAWLKNGWHIVRGYMGSQAAAHTHAMRKNRGKETVSTGD